MVPANAVLTPIGSPLARFGTCPSIPLGAPTRNKRMAAILPRARYETSSTTRGVRRANAAGLLPPLRRDKKLGGVRRQARRSIRDGTHINHTCVYRKLHPY